MKYIADDGKVFDNECECSAYEAKLREFSEQKEKDYEELCRLENELAEADRKYTEASENFRSKYGDTREVITVDELFHRLFSI